MTGKPFYDTKICVHPSDNSVEFLYTGAVQIRVSLTVEKLEFSFILSVTI